VAVGGDKTESGRVIRIDILMCTFRRPEVTQALTALTQQISPDGVELAIIVADNDATESARELVASVSKTSPIPITYIHAPKHNISVARNACLDSTNADWIVFVDDDEIAPNDWIVSLWEYANQSSVNAVFGPANAIYPDGAPSWVVQLDLHSNLAAPKRGIVETGYTSNAMLSWKGQIWADQRFELARGRSGGEDTEFFFRLGRLGATFGFAEKAAVVEHVPHDRLSMTWLRRRRFRMGQSYVSSATSRRERATLGLKALMKLVFCFLRSGLHILDPVKRRFWFLRGVLHCGVVAGCLSVRDLELY